MWRGKGCSSEASESACKAPSWEFEVAENHSFLPLNDCGKTHTYIFFWGVQTPKHICVSEGVRETVFFFNPPPVTITIMSNWNRGSADNGPKAHSPPHLHNNNHSNRFFVEGAGQQVSPRKKRHEKEARKHRSAEIRFRPHHSDNNNNFDCFFLGGGQATRTTSVEEGKSTALQARSQRPPPTPATTTTPAFFFFGGGARTTTTSAQEGKRRT